MYTHRIQMLCLCGLKSLMINWHNGMMLPKSVNKRVYGVHTSCLYGINFLKPSGFFMYHQVKHAKILHNACCVQSVLYRSQNRQWPLVYTSLTEWFL
jgi:hypothetical protein